MPRMARNAERRTLLSDAAVRVMSRQGSRGLTYRAIDAEAGVPTGTSSNYFGSRDEIIAALLTRISERLQPESGSDVPLAEGTEDTRGVEVFAAYLRDIVHRLTADRDAALALFELRLDATRRPSVAEALRAWRRDGLAADVEFSRTMGLPGDRSDIVLFHYALDGLLLDRLTVPIDDDADPDEAVTALARRILGH
jgi:AcrR family transcriptional regulator